MRGTPFALVPEIEIAERTSERQVAVVGTVVPCQRRRLEVAERAVDLGLLALSTADATCLPGADAGL